MNFSKLVTAVATRMFNRQIRAEMINALEEGYDHVVITLNIRGGTVTPWVHRVHEDELLPGDPWQHRLIHVETFLWGKMLA